MNSEQINPEFSALSLKWKSWRWFLLIAFNISVLSLLTLFKILLDKRFISTENSKSIFVAVLIPISMTLLCAYIIFSTKFKKDYSTLIKEQRFNYFWKGISVSFLSCFCLIIGLLALMKDHNVIFYFCIAIASLTGLISSGFITLYEFCINWDIFYSKNKETIVKEYLKRQNKLKIKEDIKEHES